MLLLFFCCLNSTVVTIAEVSDGFETSFYFVRHRDHPKTNNRKRAYAGSSRCEHVAPI
jgi:predicted adenine nucleotide alpha hydrolase (AANH) superfamily ATPase